MKEIYFITAYTPTFDRQQALRNLVHSIKEQGKEILVISHSTIAKDIEDMCDYTIFDRENKLIYDSTTQYWSSSVMNNLRFEYINLNSSYTILPVYKLFLGGLAYLKSLNYDIVHFLEYDCEIKDFTYFENVKESLISGEYDMHACYDTEKFTDTYVTLPISVNIKKLDFEQLIYDEKKLLKEYEYRFRKQIYPITETINYQIVWKDLNKKVVHENELKDVIITNFNYKFGRPDRSSFNITNGSLHFLHDNMTNPKGNLFDIIVTDTNGNKTSKSMVVPYIRCYWLNLDIEYTKVRAIKIYLNGSFYRTLDLMNPKDRFYIESAKIIQF
jgi:hypothetical protein